MRCLRQLTIQGTRNHGRRWEAVVTLDGVLSLFFFVFFGSHLRESEEKVQVNENLNKCCSVKLFSVEYRSCRLHVLVRRPHKKRSTARSHAAQLQCSTHVHGCAHAPHTAAWLLCFMVRSEPRAFMDRCDRIDLDDFFASVRRDPCWRRERDEFAPSKRLALLLLLPLPPPCPFVAARAPCTSDLGPALLAPGFDDRPADRKSLCTSENKCDTGTLSCWASSGTIPLAGRPPTPCRMMFSRKTTVNAPTSDSARPFIPPSPS